MGEAYDQGGNVIASAFGKTKQEVMDKLTEAAPDAARCESSLTRQQCKRVRGRKSECNDMSTQSGQFAGNMPMQRKTLSIQRRRELLSLAAEASDWLIGRNVKPHELCFFKQAVGMLTDTRD